MVVAEIVSLDVSIGGQRGVVAQTDISSGTLIILEWPIIAWKQFDFSQNNVLLQMIEQIIQNPIAFGITKELHPINLSVLDSKEIESIQSQFQQTNLLAFAEEQSQSIEEIYRLLLVIKHNAFGSGLYDKLCMVNHSCQPNCMKFEPRSASRGASEVWSLRPIRKGEEITINYLTPIEQITPAMRKYLYQQHYFHCQCQRCQHYQDILELIEELRRMKMNDVGSGNYEASLLEMENLLQEKEHEVLQFIEQQSSSSFVVSNEEDEEIERLYQTIDQLLARLHDLKQTVLSLLENNGKLIAFDDDNLDRLEGRIHQIKRQLLQFHLENIIIPYYQTKKAKTMKGLLTPQHQSILTLYLVTNILILLLQTQYYKAIDHPLLSTVLTDILHSIEYLQFFFEDSLIEQEISLALRTWKAENATQKRNHPGVFAPYLNDETNSVHKLSDVAKALKKETNRLKSLYLLATRCKAAIFVPKEAGHYWGELSLN